MKLGFVVAAFSAVLLSSAAAQACDAFCFDADAVAKSVVCQVKDVTVLAKTDADCKTLGGEVGKADAAK